MTHSMIWLTEAATPDMTALIGTAMIKGASKEELAFIVNTIEDYILSNEMYGAKTLEYFNTKYSIDHMPDIATLYFNMSAKGAPKKELMFVDDYYNGFNFDVLKGAPDKNIRKLKQMYMN